MNIFVEDRVYLSEMIICPDVHISVISLPPLTLLSDYKQYSEVHTERLYGILSH